MRHKFTTKENVFGDSSPEGAENLLFLRNNIVFAYQVIHSTLHLEILLLGKFCFEEPLFPISVYMIWV